MPCLRDARERSMRCAEPHRSSILGVGSWRPFWFDYIFRSMIFGQVIAKIRHGGGSRMIAFWPFTEVVRCWFLGGGCLRRKKSLLFFRDKQKLWRKSHFIPSYVVSFFSFNLSYILKKTNFGLMTRHIFTINPITKAGRVFNTWRDRSETIPTIFLLCTIWQDTLESILESIHQSGCKKQRRSLTAHHFATHWWWVYPQRAFFALKF